MMEYILTGVLAILTVLIWWQSFFQNNITLFQKRMELYQDFSRKYHIFINDADLCLKSWVFLRSDDPEVKDDNRKTKLNFLQKYSDLEGATNPMMFVGFSNKINELLDQCIHDADIITDFITQTDRRGSKISTEQASSALKRLESASNADSELNIRFQLELPLRNFRFYQKRLWHKICGFFKKDV